MKCSIQEELNESFSLRFRFQIIVHVLTILYMYYPSLNKL